MVYSAYFVMVQCVLLIVRWVGYRSNERVNKFCKLWISNRLDGRVSQALDGGPTYRGMSPVVDNVVDARRWMQQQKLTPLIPCYRQRVSLINPTPASDANIKFDVRAKT